MSEDKLIETAVKYREKAYAPYSNFKVGAAVECASGNIYGGCNVENTSYGVTICAERVAVVKAISEGEREIKRMAIVTSNTGVSLPCGACRQVIIEFGKNAEILCCDVNSVCERYMAEELIPHYDKQGIFKKNLNELKKKDNI